MKAVLMIGLICSWMFSATWVVAESNKKLGWNEAKEFCMKKGGRLPTVFELKNAGTSNFKKYFKKDFYWSNDENSNNLDEAKYYNFYDKSSYFSPKSFKLNVRCVSK